MVPRVKTPLARKRPSREGRQGNFKTSKLITFSLIVAAVTWLKYCRYGVKLYSVNQSINQSNNSNLYLRMMWIEYIQNTDLLETNWLRLFFAFPPYLNLTSPKLYTSTTCPAFWSHKAFVFPLYKTFPASFIVYFNCHQPISILEYLVHPFWIPTFRW